MSIATLIVPGLGSFGNIATKLTNGLASYTNLPQPPVAGRQYLTCRVAPYTGTGFSLQQGVTPTVVVPDVFVTQLVTSPGGYQIQINSDGTLEIFSSGDTSRQSFLYWIFHAATNFMDGPGTVWINAMPPAWGRGYITPADLAPNVVITPISLAGAPYATSPSGDTLVFALASGALPPGLSLSSSGVISGTPTLSGLYTFTVSATDLAGLTTVSPQCQMVVKFGMPNYTGFTDAAAVASVLSLGLTIGYNAGVFSPSIPIGIIVSQFPLPDAPLVTGGSVLFTYSLGPMTPYGRNVPKGRPSVRKIDERSLSYGVGGPEQPYPVYEFSGGRAKYEYPKHNPFKDE